MPPDPVYDGASFQNDVAGVSRETLERLERYADLLGKWNKSINLVSRDSLNDVWRRHFLDSAQLVQYMPAAPEGRPRVVVDLGSGAGFPALVLAILGQGDVHLIESDQRKTVFLREVSRETGCRVTIHNKRIENVPPFRADVVTARAFAPLSKLLDYAWPFLSKKADDRPFMGVQEQSGNGQLLLLKGRSVDQELTEAGKRWSMQVERFASRSSLDGHILRLDALPIED